MKRAVIKVQLQILEGLPLISFENIVEIYI